LLVFNYERRLCNCPPPLVITVSLPLQIQATHAIWCHDRSFFRKLSFGGGRTALLEGGSESSEEASSSSKSWTDPVSATGSDDSATGSDVSATGSDVRIFLDGVEKSTRPSQRWDLFRVGVVEAGPGVVAAVDVAFDKYAISKRRSARQLASVRPTTFPVTITNEPEAGTLTFSQRLLFWKKQTAGNCTGAALELSYTVFRNSKCRGSSSGSSSPPVPTVPVMVTIGHHCSGK